MLARQPKILILDGMWNKTLAVVRSLGKRGFNITIGEKTRLSTTFFSKYISKRYIYPSPIRKKEEFLESLESELKNGSYDVVLPMEYSTQILLTDPANRQRLERYTRIPFADANLTRSLNDKGIVMKYALDHGIGIPETYWFDNLSDISNRVNNIKYPVLIKPRNSSGSRGIVYVFKENELIDSYMKVHERYPFPIIQECLPVNGVAYGVGLLLNFQSEVRASFVYKRLRTYPIKGGPSTLRESVIMDDVREIAEGLMKSLKWIGVAHVEFMVDQRDKRPKLIEINPRFWGSLQLAIESGVDFPYLLYKMAIEGDVEPVKRYIEGVRCRWLVPGDILHFIKNPDRFGLKPSFFDFSIKDDIISFHDPLPIFGRILSGLTLIFDKDMRELLKK